MTGNVLEHLYKWWWLGDGVLLLFTTNFQPLEYNISYPFCHQLIETNQLSLNVVGFAGRRSRLTLFETCWTHAETPLQPFRKNAEADLLSKRLHLAAGLNWYSLYCCGCLMMFVGICVLYFYGSLASLLGEHWSKSHNDHNVASFMEVYRFTTIQQTI